MALQRAIGLSASVAHLAQGHPMVLKNCQQYKRVRTSMVLDDICKRIRIEE